MDRLDTWLNAQRGWRRESLMWLWLTMTAEWRYMRRLRNQPGGGVVGATA